MASHFNDDDPVTGLGGQGAVQVTEAPASAPAEPSTAAPVQPAADALVPEAVIKFRSCRWRRPPEDGPECCGHRDVLPIAGTASFDPNAWCPDCTYFKLRRMPKKKSYY